MAHKIYHTPVHNTHTTVTELIKRNVTGTHMWYFFICSTYFIVAPSVFRPGQPYKLRVTLSSALSSSVNIECGIMDRMKKQIILGQSGVFSPGENQNQNNCDQYDSNCSLE